MQKPEELKCEKREKGIDKVYLFDIKVYTQFLNILKTWNFGKIFNPMSLSLWKISGCASVWYICLYVVSTHILL